jgi:DNA-binding NtrC family response regulator
MSTSGYHVATPSRPSFRKTPHSLEDTDTSIGASEFEMVGSSAAMHRLRLQVRRIGPHFRTMLVSGEAGSGKELTARALHTMSQGADGPFVVCDAPSLGDAKNDQVAGAIKMAHRGTLFVDGISELSTEAQSQLLRVLRRHEWAQEGLASPHKTNLRIIASSSQDLRALVSAGRFQQDIYHRVATLTIALPPLRERIEDVPELAAYFLRRYAHAYSKPVSRIAEEVMNQLTLFRWPGNVRELENVVHHAVLLSEGAVLEAHELPPFAEPGVSALSNASGAVRLQDIVEQHVTQVLKSCAGNKLRTAETLGISRSTLYRMLDACAQDNTFR